MDIRLRFKPIATFLLIIFGASLISSCSALKDCDCPGLGTHINEIETIQHS